MSRFAPLVFGFALVSLFGVTGTSAIAQGSSRFDVAGGYAYLHEIDLSVPGGWFASGAGNLNAWYGVVGAVSGHYKTEDILGVDVKTRLHTYTVGPRFQSQANPRFTPYAQILFGGAHVSGTAQVPGTTQTVDVSDNGFDVQPGAGLDLYPSNNVGIRVGINGDFICASGETNKEFQFVVGVVIRN